MSEDLTTPELKKRRRRRVRRKPVERPGVEKVHAKLDWVWAGLLAMAPLALGGTHPYAAFGLSVASILITALHLGVYAASGKPARWSPVSVAFVGFAAWIWLRSLPPFGFMANSLERQAAELWPGVSARATMAPGLAALAAVKTLGVAAAAQYASTRCASSNQLKRVGFAIVAGAGAILFVGAAQTALGAERILGLYQPLQWDRVTPLSGPFVNGNQAGSYVGLAAIIAAAAVLITRNRKLVPAAVSVAIASTLYTIAVGARGATLAIAGALFVLLAQVYGNRVAADRTQQALAYVVLAVVTVATAVFAWVIVPASSLPLPETAVLKAGVWADSLSLPLDAPMLGYGAGSFPSVFPSVQTTGAGERYVYVESAPLQLAIEHGLILALCVLAAIVFLLVRSSRRDQRSGAGLQEAKFAIVAYVALEAITGAGLLASSYALAVGALAGIMMGRTASRREEHSMPGGLAAAGVFGLFAMALIVAAPGAVRNTLLDSTQPAAAELARPNPDAAAVDSALRTRAAIAPGDPDLLFQAAAVRLARGDVESAALPARYLTSHAPRFPGTWLLAFEVANAAGRRDEACHALKMHLERNELPDLTALNRYSGNAGDWYDCMPTDPAVRNRIYNRVQRPRFRRDAVLLFLEVAAREPDNTAVLSRLASHFAAEDEPMLAVIYARLLLNHGPATEGEFHTAARTLVDAGYDTDAQLALRQAVTDFPNSAALRLLFIEVSLRLLEQQEQAGDWYPSIVTHLDAARGASASSPALAIRYHELRGQAAMLAEDWPTALDAYRSVIARRSADTATLLRLAEISENLGDRRAARGYREQAGQPAIPRERPDDTE